MKKYFLSIFIVFLALGRCFIGSGYAITGDVEYFSDEQPEADNWAVPHPKIVIALGLLQSDLISEYAEVGADIIQRAMPDVEVKILSFARGSDIVNELRDKRTVGLLFISHTYQTDSNTAILIGADWGILPNEILSVATPSLRFIAFIGCHGSEVIKHYQVKYEAARLPGRQEIYYTSTSLVTTKDILYFFKGGVEEALENISEKIRKYNFQTGGSSPQDRFGVLAIEAKDVVNGIEPRYVFVNNHMVGVLGTLDDGSFIHSPDVSQYMQFYFPVESYLLATSKPLKITIRSAELTPGAPADDYLVKSIRLHGDGKTWNKIYDPPVHVGDDSAPYQGLSVHPPAFPLVSQEDVQVAQNYLKDMEWEEREPSLWPPLSKRFFIDFLD